MMELLHRRDFWGRGLLAPLTECESQRDGCRASGQGRN
jgi:hypothetical protein